eukprot:Platyproteum_vivax@DN6198_c0_g1_i1.p1
MLADRLVFEYLARNGLMHISTQLHDKCGLIDLVDLEIWMEASAVTKSLREHDLKEAFVWCTTHKSKLKKIESTLEVQLHLQHFLEEVKRLKATTSAETSSQFAEPLKYLKDHLADVDLASVKDLSTILGFVAMPPQPDHAYLLKKYQFLESEGRWKALQKLFEQNFCSIYGLLPTQSTLEVVVKAGFMALNTPLCRENITANCPACDPDLQHWLKRMPIPHRVETQFVCPVTGEVADASNPPVACPQGHILSLKALAQLPVSKDGGIMCPKCDHAVGSVDDFQRIYS